MKEFISHILKQVAAILEYVIAFMRAIGIILLVIGFPQYPLSGCVSELR